VNSHSCSTADVILLAVYFEETDRFLLQNWWILWRYNMPFYKVLPMKAIYDQKPAANIGTFIRSDAYCVMHNFEVRNSEIFTERMSLLLFC
jgi:hypothetical protein